MTGAHRILVVDPDPACSQTVAILLKRFGDQVVWVPSVQEAVARLAHNPADLLLLDERLAGGGAVEQLTRASQPSRPPVVLFSEPRSVARLIDAYRQGVAYCVITPFHARELVSCLYALLRGQRRVVCLGGGTGLYTLLLGLKTLPNVHLTSVVSMSDDGGSSGRIREAFGVLPPGDVRRSLVALSTAPALMNDLFQYRFGEGEGLKGHHLGNLLLTAMANLKGSMPEAVRALGDVLNIQGLVLPVTTTLSTLVAELADGTVVRGEHRIDVPQGRDPTVRIAELRQEPDAEANPDALSAILSADLLLIGPGDLFTSVIATLTVAGIPEAICASRARKVYICNLMTKPGETSGFTAADHIQEVVRYLGADVLDDVVVSNTAFSEEALRQYALKDQEPVHLGDAARVKRVTRARIITADVGLEEELVRHHSVKLAGTVAQLLASPERAEPLEHLTS